MSKIAEVPFCLAALALLLVADPRMAVSQTTSAGFSLHLDRLPAITSLEPANLTTGAGSDPEVGQAPPVSGISAREWHLFRSDLAAFVHVPIELDARQWRHLGYAAAAIAASSLLDQKVRRRTEDGSNDGRDSQVRVLRPLGQEAGIALAGLAYLAGRAFHRPGWAEAGGDAIEASILASALVVPAIKLTVGRARPNAGSGASSFKPFGGDQSFPSGEATQVFALAAVFSSHTHSRWVQVSLWGLAAAVSYQRLELDAHWTSDLVAGALIGASIGRWVVRRHRSAEQGFSLSAAPVATRGRGFGLGFRVAW